MAKIIDNNLENKENLGNNQETPTNNKSIVNTIGSFLPFAPLLFEQLTGQKIPQTTGTIAEIQTSVSQLTLSLQQVITNQQQIFTKLTNLETNANNQLLSLDKRLQNLRLTHEREKKQIEYNAKSSPEEENINPYV